METIGENAFFGCSGLTSVTIPSSVTSIRQGAFFYCRKLTEVTSLNEEPPTLGKYAFYGCDIETVYVPKGTAEKYKAAAGWLEFSNIKEIGTSTGIEDINGEKVTIRANGGALNISGAKDGARVVVYTMTGAKVGETRIAGGTATIPTGLRRGDIAIVRISGTSVKVMMQ